MLMHGGERRQPEVFSYLGECRRIAMLADKMLQVIDHLLLSPRESRHLHKPPAFSPILAKIWRKSALCSKTATRIRRSSSIRKRHRSSTTAYRGPFSISCLDITPTSSTPAVETAH